MSAAAARPTRGSGSFRRGIHPPASKELAADKAIEVLPTPDTVQVPLLQHIGAPCTTELKPKQLVARGEKIGEPGGFVSAPVHASIRGFASRPTAVTLANARHVPAIPIKKDGEQLEGQALFDDVLGGSWPKTGLDAWSPEQIREACKNAGLVGQGGAAFPTHVKLAPNKDKPVDAVLINGCECEPYLTADYRLMLEAADAIVCGALLAARATGATTVGVATEDNKKPAIAALEKAVAGTNVRVAALASKYPMGGEKQTVRAALGRTIPTGGLPLDVGVVVMNVATAAALARATVRGKPLTHRVVTVTGRGIAQPKNLLVPIGTSIKSLLQFCGGLTQDAARVVAGGPMMGFTLGSMDAPVTKGTSGITVLTRADLKEAEETNCLRCGRCVDVCPLNLVPTRIALASRHADWDLARRYHILACMECGCCSYACPASVPLVQLIRSGKARLPRS